MNTYVLIENTFNMNALGEPPKVNIERRKFADDDEALIAVYEMTHRKRQEAERTPGIGEFAYSVEILRPVQRMMVKCIPRDRIEEEPDAQF